MKGIKLVVALGVLAGLAMSAGAQTVINNDITTSTTWTKAGNPYSFGTQIYVTNGATLTIEAGVIVKSAPTANGSGSLAVTRGSKIRVLGTKDEPVIMTSTNDTNAGDGPGTGTWREAALEWGNLTIMGDALISRSYDSGNTKTPTGLNEANMEGLTDAVKRKYGGDNDDDDSGEIHYLSLRYGGRVVGLANELNGLSLGGIGRATEIDHVEIMNNVDDGIEIWGGTVNLKYVSIWNIGDDSFDIDQGWRGKAQFGLIVQGHSLDADQGSGVGDNCFETDGSEDSDAQPVTTATIYNFTAIGQPHTSKGGDGATTWRDNARVQYRNCIFMNIGNKVVRFDNIDGDGANGYGHNTTLSWAATWTTDYSHSHDWAQTVNAYGATEPATTDFRHPQNLYKAQVDGKLAEIKDSVFFQNANTAAYTEATARGVFDAANNNVQEPANSPIQGITRNLNGGVGVVRGGHTMYPVTSLNPCAANDAVTSVNTAPADGFFTPVKFRGGFSKDNNWMAGWTAADEFGLIVTTMNAADPTATGELAKVETKTTFDTDAGVIYTIEKSTDMRNWVPAGVVTGTGSTMEFSDLDSFENGKFYRAIRQ